MKKLYRFFLKFFIYAPALRWAIDDVEKSKSKGESPNILAIRFFKFKLHTLKHNH